MNKIKVIIIESEAGWGQRVDEVKEFDDRATAEEFVKDFNKDNNEPVTPKLVHVCLHQR